MRKNKEYKVLGINTNLEIDKYGNMKIYLVIPTHKKYFFILLMVI